MQFSRELLQQIRDRVDMVELVSSYTHLERRGDRWWGLSPFKSEKTPSFTVRPGDGFYYCFATQQGGDLFTFVREMEGLSFPEAVQWLADRAGVELDESGEIDDDERARRALLELYDRVTGTFRYLLRQDARGEHALAYITGRGVGTSTIERFELGYTVGQPDWLYRLLRSKSYSDSFLESSGLFSRHDSRRALFRNRLIFPIRDARKRVVAFGGRALDRDAKAKYINSPETAIYRKKSTLYGLAQAIDSMRRDRTVFLSEGYMDVLALHQAGVENVVAPLGTAFTPEQAQLLKRWVDKVVFIFDSDSAGIEATFRGTMVAEEAGLDCAVVSLGASKDPADLLVDDGAKALQELVSHSEAALSYLIRSAMHTYADEEASRRSELVLLKLFPYIKMVRSEVRRETALDVLAEALGVGAAAIRSDFQTWQYGERTQQRSRTGVEIRKPTTIRREMALLLATAHGSGLFAYLRRFVTVDDISDSEARRLYLLMEDAYRHGDELPQGLVDRLDGELRDEVVSRLSSEEFMEFGERDIDRAIKRITLDRLRQQQQELTAAIRATEPGRDDLVAELLQEKAAVDRELKEHEEGMRE